MEWAGAGEAWRLLRMIAACAWVGNPQSRTGSNKEEQRNHVIFAEAIRYEWLSPQLLSDCPLADQAGVKYTG